MATVAPAQFELETFFAQEHARDLLRLVTAGSVDDGKSTLIGRLLYDSQSVYEDQLRAIGRASVNGESGAPDLSLLTDGLRAEREQGITIDVAYRYFATAKRKFILADTPGHEQYTRNMATGASTADLAILLVDARKGAQTQTKRHAYIATLLGVRHMVVAINKMDAVDYDQARFDAIRSEVLDFLAALSMDGAYFVPISALVGDNIVRRSGNMPWFYGVPLLEHLENVHIQKPISASPFRLPVQRVVRPHQDFRGYAGQIASGIVRPGDPVNVLPSGKKSRVKSIVSFDGDLDIAFAPMSIMLTLEDEIDISRGELICAVHERPQVAWLHEAELIWFDQRSLELSRPYLLKHASQSTTAEVKVLHYRVDVDSLTQRAADTLSMNDIGVVQLETARPLFFDAYAQNRMMGSAILIDPETNATVGAALLLRPTVINQDGESDEAGSSQTERLSKAERLQRFGHSAALVRLNQHADLAYLLERKLFERGAAVVVLHKWSHEAVEVLLDSGFIVLALDVPARVPAVDALPLSDDNDDAAAEVFARILRPLFAKV